MKKQSKKKLKVYVVFNFVTDRIEAIYSNFMNAYSHKIKRITPKLEGTYYGDKEIAVLKFSVRDLHLLSCSSTKH